MNARRGAALMVALIAVLLLASFAGGIFVMATDTQRHAVGLLESDRSLALAEAGAEWAVKRGRSTSAPMAFGQGTFSVAKRGRPGDLVYGLATGTQAAQPYTASAQWASTGRAGAGRRILQLGTNSALAAGAQLACNDYVNALAAADFDGDGDTDLAAGIASGKFHVWLNSGTGTFSEAASSPYTANSSVDSLAAADMNGDGYVDLVLAGKAVDPSKVEVWLNDGSAGFSLKGRWDLGGVGCSLALRDVLEDADADVDAVVTNDAGQFEVWVNDGSGGLSQSSAQASNDASVANGIVLSDVDQDGDNDAMLATQGKHLEYWQNDGAGSFTFKSDLTLSGVGYCLAAGELDGNAGEDILVGEGSTTFEIFLNDGSGTFSLGSTTTVLGDVHAAALFDMDGDGDLDAVLGEVALDRVQIYLDNGVGGFTFDRTIVAGGEARSVVAAEFNYAQ